MHFDVSTLTTAGKALLTRATAGAKIIWGTCGCFTQSTPGVSSTSLIGKVASGTAVAVFQSTDNTAKISCSVDNTASGLSAGSANSFGLWAKIEGDSTETLVLIAYVTTTPATYFPTYSGVSTKVGAIIDISVTVSDGVVQTINLVESGYALAANLQLEIDEREALAANLQAEIDEREALAARVVTTYTANSQTTGDAQTVYGRKTFRNGIEATDAKVLTINNANITTRNVIPTTDPEKIIISGVSEDYPWTELVAILKDVSDKSEAQLREYCMMCSQGGTIVLSETEITSLGSSNIVVNCGLNEVLTKLGDSGELATYSTVNDPSIGSQSNPFQKLYASEINGSLNNATGVLQSLYKNEIGALVEIKLASKGTASTMATTTTLARGQVVRNGHYYDNGGQEDPSEIIIAPMVYINVTSDDISVTDDMSFAILKKCAFTIPGNTSSSNATMSGNTVTVWAIRTA